MAKKYFTDESLQTLVDETKAYVDDIASGKSDTNHTHTWGDIQGKPFETIGGDTLTWDGNTEGLENMSGVLYKVSDSVPTLDDLQNGGVVSITDSENGIRTTQFGIDDCELDLEPGGVIGIGKFGSNSPNSISMPIVYIVPTDVTMNGSPLTKGVYFIYMMISDSDITYVSSLTINGYTGFGKEVIKEEYLPFIITSGADTDTFVLSEHEAAFTVDFGEGLLTPFYDLGETTAEDLLAGVEININTPDGNVTLNDIEGDYAGSSAIVESTDDFTMIHLFFGLYGIIITKIDNCDVEGLVIPNAGVWLYNFAWASGFEINYIKLLNSTFKLAGKKIEQSYVATDWEESDKTSVSYIKNKPFGEEVTYSNTLTWDGGNGGTGSYYVNDNVPDFNDFIGAEISIYNTDSNSSEKYSVTEADINSFDDGYVICEGAIIVTKRDNVPAGDYILLKKGIYISKFSTTGSADGRYAYVTEIVAPKDIFAITKIKQLDTKYLEPFETVNGNTLLKPEYLSEQALANLGGIGMKLLWTNASPNSSFSGQSVSLDLTDYDMVDIFCFMVSNGMNRNFHTKVLKNGSGQLTAPMVTSSSHGIELRTRPITSVNDNGVTFADGYLALNGQAETKDNYICVPYKIYGIKGVK